MRKIYQTLLPCLFLAASACQSSDNTQEMLQDEKVRQEVYNTILENEETRNELIAEMRERNLRGPMGRGGMMQGDGMMEDTTSMRGMNPQQMQARMQQMMAVCGTDTAACTMMTDMMLQNRALMGNMMRQIRQRGRMEPGCMQQLMREIDL